MRREILLLLSILSVFAANTTYHAQVRVRSTLSGSLELAADNNPNNQQLQLATKVIKETYCEGPDPELVTLRLLIRLSFTNTGSQKIIIERGGKSAPVTRVSKTAEDAMANRFEMTINSYLVTDSSKSQRVLKRPPLAHFAILASGQSYNTITEISIPVPRSSPVPAIITSGSHYLQIGVWTWDESQEEAKVKRKAWQREGFLWSESVFSKPMPFTVRSQPQPADCRCQNPNISDTDAIDIASKRSKAFTSPLGSYKSIAVEHGCEWQVVFESRVKRSDKPSFIFIIDKKSGEILGEFQ